MLADRIQAWAQTQPRRTAVIHGDTAIDYAQFAHAIGAAMAAIAGHDVPPRGTGVVLVQNLLMAWTIATALRALGLDSIAVGSVEQAERLQLNDTACLAVVDPESRRLDLRRAPEVSRRLVVLDAKIFVPRHAAGDIAPAQSARPGGHLLYTSGTTGTYKLVLLDGAREDARNAERAHNWSLDTTTVHHGLDYGLWTALGYKQPAATWHAGGCVIFDQGAQRFARFFRHRPNRTYLMVPMLQDLVASGAAADTPIAIATAGGFLPGKLAAAAQRLARSLLFTYGTTEINAHVLAAPIATGDDVHWLSPTGHRVLQIVDAGGAACPVGTEGELRIVRSDLDCAGYRDDAAATGRFFHDGGFHPGDLAVRRADGKIRILGRTGDVLNIRGQKRAVAPIEQAIRDHLKVTEVCLFSGLNAHGQEELVIAIETDRAPPRAALERVTAKFPFFERVRIAVVPQFPRTTTGSRKTRRADLRKLVFPG